MSRLESVERIEFIVGAKRRAIDHLARAVSSEQRVYVLHSRECVASGIDLRECEFSLALDLGIDMGIWNAFQDRPVKVIVDGEHDDLVPIPLPQSHGSEGEQ